MFTRSCIAVAALLCTTACSSGGPSDVITTSPTAVTPGTAAGPLVPDWQAGSLASLAAPRAVAELIQEVATAPVPAGVDPVIFEALRTELIRVLSQRSVAATGSPRLEPTSRPGERTVSFTPYGYVNRVDDLVLAGSEPYRLSWTYQSRGDYDLNGMVNVSDLTPIGIYYGLSKADPRWLLAAAADGDGNGMITVSDITPLGQYFGGLIVGYQVWGCADPAGEWSHVANATVETNLNKNPLRPRFVVELPALDYEYFSLWPYDNSDDEGSWSNIAVLNQPEHRRVVNMENIWHPE